MKFRTNEDYKNWISSQDWYQTINLPSGIDINGKFSTDKRIDYLEKFDFHNKSVLDIGCNSGQYCIFAKNNKASEVYGVDISSKRINQAKILAENENLQINYFNEDIIKFSKNINRKFDYIFCFAVLTEIKDIITVLEIIKKNMTHHAILEMGISKPFIYLPFNLKSLFNLIKHKKYTAEINYHKHAGWVFHPSISFIKNFFGTNYNIKFLNRGIRYDLILIKKI